MLILLLRVVCLTLVVCLSSMAVVEHTTDTMHTAHHLRLSVRDLRATVSSCEYTIGQLEVFNVHSTLPVEITSVQTKHQWIEPYDDDSFIDDGEGDLLGDELISECPELPEQFISNTHHPMTLQPGQIVVLPLAMFPRFPLPVEHSTVSSYFQKADWEAIPMPRRSNRYIESSHQQQLTSTTVELETSRGTVQMPLTVISQRHNLYGLVDVIAFKPYHEETDDDYITAALRDIQASKRTFQEEPPDVSTATTSFRIQLHHQVHSDSDDSYDIRSDHDCYDIYVNGLPYGSYEIQSVRLVHALERMKLYVVPGQGNLKPTRVGVSRISHWNVVMSEHESSVFPHDGTLTIPMLPDDQDDDEEDPRHYVVTVCRVGNSVTETTTTDEEEEVEEDWIPPKESETSLGFLLLETSQGPLAVALEEEPSIRAPTLITADPLYNGTTSNLMQLDDALVNITFYKTSLPHSTVDVTAQIHAPLKIMRASVSVELPYGIHNSNETVGIRLQLNNVPLAPLQAGHHTVAQITTHMDWQQLRDYFPDDDTSTWVIRGALILHVTRDTEMSYSQWLDRLHPSLYGSDQILEVPIEIHLCRTFHVTLAVQKTTHPVPTFWNLRLYNGVTTITDAAFFPAYPEITKNAVPPSIQHKLKDAHMDGSEHQLRIFTNSVDGIQVHRVGIRDNNDDDSTDPLHCNKLFSVHRMEDVAVDRKKLHPYFHIGHILLQYRFPRTVPALHELPIQPKLCTLTFETQPSTGPHELPLLVYSGRLAIDTQDPTQDPPRVTNTTMNPAEALVHYESTTDSSLSGFDSVLEWFRHSKSGYALRSLIKSLASKDSDALRRYLQNLSKSIITDERQQTIVNPILLNAGAVAQGETETVPIYFTNFNPVPITVSIDVGEVEGFAVELGVDDSFRTLESPSLFDLLGRLRKDETARASVGRFKGQSIEALRNFLRADRVAARFFERFPFRDDVTTSAQAISSYGPVRRQFQEYAKSTYSKNARSSRFADDAWNACNTNVRPPEYGSFQRKLKLENKKGTGPLMISSDRRMQRELNVCWYAKGEPEHKLSDRGSIQIPPMGKARFDVTIRAPSSSVLEKDITSFLTTGLALSTNHGELIPILMNFEALRGKLEVSHIPSIGGSATHSVDHTIHVPAGLFGIATMSDSEFIRIPPHHAHSLSHLKAGAAIVPRNVSTVESGVSLYVKSSFHRDIQLREVVSCNPWFRVSLANQSSTTTEDPLLGIHIGTVSNVVSCDGVDGLPQNKTLHPSFYRCALSWITKRLILQPKGCGSIDSRDGRRSSVDSARENDLIELISSVKRALVVTEWLDSLSTNTGDHASASPMQARSNDVFIGSLLTKAITLARKELVRASESGLLSLGTALRAVVQYNSTPDESAPVARGSPAADHEASRLISLAIRNVTISSFLDIPSLLTTTDFSEQPTISFPPTHVFDVSSVMIPLRNPTSVPVRVRLGIAPHGSDEIDQHRLGNSHKMPYVHGHKGHLGSPQDFASLHWWEKEGSYYFPDQLGDAIRSHHNLTLKNGTGALITMANPSFFASSAFLLGCATRCGLTPLPKDNTRKETLVDLTPSSPIGASAAGGVLLRGYFGMDSVFKVDHKAHPLNLHAGGSLYTNLQGPASFALSRTALDEIVIPPFSEAELGPVLFHPSGRTPRIGCGSIRGNRNIEDCSSQLFETSLYLENSLSGLEAFSLRGRALWESIVFLDPSEDEFGHIEFRNGEHTVLFSGSAIESRDYLYPIPEIISVVVHNDGDTAVAITSGGFVDAKSGLEGSASCGAGTFELIDCSETFPFFLRPNQNYTLLVGQFATCAKMKEYQRLVLNFERVVSNEDTSDSDSETFQSKQQKFRQSEKIYPKQINIMVGYEIQSAALATCINNFRYPLDSKNEKASGRSKRVWRRRFPLLRVIILVSCVLFLVDKLLNAWVRVIMTNVSFERFVSNLGKTETLNNGWSTSFALLSQSNEIAAAELEAMSTDRNTMILQSTSRDLGMSAPQARSYNATRNNAVNIKAPAAKGVSNRQGSVISDRVRASEGIFGRFNPDIDISPGKLPVNIGWRIAASRGYINAGTFATGSIKLRTANLMEDRRIAAERKLEKLDGADSLDGSSLTTGYGELRAEEPGSEVNGRVPKVIINGTARTFKDHPEPISPSGSESGWVDARAKPPKVPQCEAPRPPPPSPKATKSSKQSSAKYITKANQGETKEQTPTPTDSVELSPTPPETAPVADPDSFPDAIPDTEEDSERTETPPSPAALRPPPGLAPPPGFGSVPFSLPAEPPPPLGGESPQLLPSFAPELTPSFTLDNNNTTSPAASNHMPESSALEGIIPGLAPAPAIEYDFNVMDFLDGLLDESQQTTIPSNPWAAGGDGLFGDGGEENFPIEEPRNSNNNNNKSDDTTFR